MAPNNPLSSWGNEKTMNLNTLILTNIQSSPYFKVQLFELKTFHEVVDEIYYRVDHLEPWEKGSRKTAGQTGMCGGVRGVGAGGIVSSAYCLLFKLFTLKLTKKQVNNLITHSDSPYIRGLGFMYIRYSQQPGDLWDWYEPYLDDEEEFDVKAGGGHIMTVGEMLRQWLVKLEWYSTLFPRIPVPIQKDLDVKLRSRPVTYGFSGYGQEEPFKEPQHIPDDEVSFGEAEKSAQTQRGGGGQGGKASGGQENLSNSNDNYSRRSPQARRRSPPIRRSPYSRDDFSRDLERERDRQRREKDKERYKHKDKEEKRRSRSRSRERRRSRSGSREKRREEKEYRKEKEHKKEKEHRKEKKSHKHSKERSKDKGRDRSRDRDASRDRERYRERDISREKERHRERDVSREKERHRERDVSREGERHRERDISREGERHRERDRSRDRERDRKYL